MFYVADMGLYIPIRNLHWDFEYLFRCLWPIVNMVKKNCGMDMLECMFYVLFYVQVY